MGRTAFAANAVAPRDFECAPPRTREDMKKKRKEKETHRQTLMGLNVRVSDSLLTTGHCVSAMS
jgi:hypothetical protein